MRTVFVDSDVLLDSILVREPFFDAATYLMTLADNPDINLCTSVHSLLNVHYLSKKHYGEKLSRQAIQELTAKLTIISEHADFIHKALKSDFTDFEDAVQYYAAQSVEVNFIITRNTKDYKHSAIPVLTAEQFLQKL